MSMTEFGFGAEADDVLEVLDAVAVGIAAAVAEVGDRRAPGAEPGQYALDVAADGPAVATLVDAGFGVFSEESGHHEPDRRLQVVLDPVDGSTNASRGFPWWATSACVLDEIGPWVSMVRNQATGTTHTAVRGEGARVDGTVLGPLPAPAPEWSMVAVNGAPPSHLGWRQFRSFGAAALDVCAVADGRLDAYLDATHTGNAPWDYLGGYLVLVEAGGVMFDAEERPLAVRGDLGRRRPVAARSDEAAREFLRRARVGGWWSGVRRWDGHDPRGE